MPDSRSNEYLRSVGSSATQIWTPEGITSHLRARRRLRGGAASKPRLTVTRALPTTTASSAPVSIDAVRRPCLLPDHPRHRDRWRRWRLHRRRLHLGGRRPEPARPETQRRRLKVLISSEGFRRLAARTPCTDPLGPLRRGLARHAREDDPGRASPVGRGQRSERVRVCVGHTATLPERGPGVANPTGRATDGGRLRLAVRERPCDPAVGLKRE